MPDRMTVPPDTGAPGAGSGVRRWRTPVTQAAATLLLSGAVGAGCGWLWWSLWSPAPDGVVARGQWFALPGGGGETAEFAGTGWYVVVAVLAGLVLGLVVGLVLDHSEVVALAALVVGSVLAAWVMYRVGLHLSPPDPEIAARTADDGTLLPGHLQVAGRSPFLAFPMGALLGAAIAFFGVTKPRRPTPIPG